MKKKFKILFLVFVCCLLISAGALLFAKIYFTPERVRILAEEKLGVLLDDKVSIARLNFSLSSGFEATGLSVGGGEGPLQIPKISFRYALPQLLRGSLVIKEIVVERPTLFLKKKGGRWNFEKYLFSAGSTGQKAPSPSQGLALLPLPVHINSLEISDLTLRMKDETRSLKWEGLDMAASAHVSGKDMRIEINVADNIKNALPSQWEAVLERSQENYASPALSLSANPQIHFQIVGVRPEEATLKGHFTLDNLLLMEGANSITTKAGLSLDLAVNPVAGEITLTHLLLDFLNENSVRLNGKIADIHSAPTIHGRLEHASLHLPSFLPFLKPFFPHLLLQGALEASAIDLESLADSSGGRQTKASGGLQLDHVSMEDESRGIKLKDLNADFKMEKMELSPSGGASGSLSMNMEMEEGIHGKNSLKGLVFQTNALSLRMLEGTPWSVAGAWTAELRSASIPEGALEGIKAGVEIQMDGPFQGQMKIKNSIKTLHYRLPDQSEFHSSATMDLRMDLAGEKFQDIKIEGKLDLPGLSVRSKEIQQTLFLSLEPKFSLNLREKKLDLESLQIHLPGNNRLAIQGAVFFKDTVNANIEINGSILLKSLSNLTSKLTNKLQMGGRVDLQRIALSLSFDQEKNAFIVQSKGNLKMNGVEVSRAKDFAKGMDGHLRWDLSGLNEKGFENASGELEADFAIASGTIEGLSLKKTKTRSTFRADAEGASLRSHTTIGGMEYLQTWPEPLSLSLETDIQSRPPGGITIAMLNFSVPELGFKHALQGELKGLESFLKEGLEANLQNITQEIQCRLKSEISLDAVRPLVLFEGSEIQGGAEAHFLLNLTPGKKLSLEGGVDFKNLSVQQGESLAFKNLHGVFPFQKSFSLETKKKEGTRKAVSKSGDALQKDFFSYLQGREKLTAESLTAFGQKLSQVHAEPSLRENSFALDRFSFQALGGYGVGHLSLSGGETGRIILGLEFAGIDANRLQGMGPDPRSTVNGNISLNLPLPGPGGEEPELGALDLEINITKIGEGTLDRLLLFIDPRESNPGIVDLRSKLKLAVPIGVWVKLKHGALSVSTQLKMLVMGGGILDIQALERVPVSRVSGFNKINDLLVQTRDFARAVNLFFAENLLLREEENQKSKNEIPNGKENIH